MNKTTKTIKPKEPLAIIIKGNPKFITDNPIADKFYNEIKLFLENLGFKVEFDAGEPYTEPKPALLWIGHSRGADRLRFAPKNTITINIGNDDGIYHPKDNVHEYDEPPNNYHFKLTKKMKDAINNAFQNILQNLK
jgi:hypothetical protein